MVEWWPKRIDDNEMIIDRIFIAYAQQELAIFPALTNE